MCTTIRYRFKEKEKNEKGKPYQRIHKCYYINDMNMQTIKNANAYELTHVIRYVY